MMSPLVALDVEEGVAVPQLFLALLAERDARALTVPDQDAAGEVVELAAATQTVAPGLPRYARRSLRMQKERHLTALQSAEATNITNRQSPTSRKALVAFLTC